MKYENAERAHNLIQLIKYKEKALADIAATTSVLVVTVPGRDNLSFPFDSGYDDHQMRLARNFVQRLKNSVEQEIKDLKIELEAL